MALGYWQTLASVISAGTASTAAARTSLLTGAKQGLYTLPANQLRVGDVLHLKANGSISSVVTTPGTARFDLSFGVAGTAVMDSSQIQLSIIAQSSVWWMVEAEGVVRVASSVGNMWWEGKFWSNNVQGSSVGPTAAGQMALVGFPLPVPPAVGANVDMTVSNILDFNFTQTVNTGSITLHSYVLSYKSASGF